MCGRIASGGVHRRGRAAAVVVVTRFAGLGRGVARFRAGAGAGVGAGSPWMHWDVGRSHSSQYSSAIGTHPSWQGGDPRSDRGLLRETRVLRSRHGLNQVTLALLDRHADGLGDPGRLRAELLPAGRVPVVAAEAAGVGWSRSYAAETAAIPSSSTETKSLCAVEGSAGP
jgi:hypothetical protein